MLPLPDLPLLKRAPWPLLVALSLAVGCAEKIAEEDSAAVPSTDIHLIALSYDSGELQFGPPRNVTRRPGYDNQPWFIPGQDAFYFAGMGTDTLTNIFRYDISSGDIVPEPSSPDAEYSPQNPLGATDAITVVRVEVDGAQRLWQFEDGAKSPLMPEITTVGYYIWIAESRLLMFLVGDTLTLHTYNFDTGVDDYLLDNPGRTFKRVPGSALISFIHKVSQQEWWIKTFDPATGAIKPLVRTLPEREDFAWLPDGRIIMSGEHSLHSWSPGGEWQELITFTDPALQGITRLAVSEGGEWLALVSAEASPQ